MKSLILTVLYLTKDTIHRWLTRLSSPVARVLVVFFLTLCALCFLGTYVISAKIMRDRIRVQGGDLVQMTLSNQKDKNTCLPSAQELHELLGVESVAVRNIGYAHNAEGRSVTIASYDFPRTSQYLPYMAASGVPTLLTWKRSRLQPGPSQVKVEGELINVFVRPLPPDTLLSKLLGRSDTLLLPPDSRLMSSIQGRQLFGTQSLLLRVQDTESSEPVRRAVKFCEDYLRLEGAQGHVISALPLLQEMDIILGNQVQCRVAFCAGIAGIVGILLTALAGMEYRQNEYIYTLMKSFGIHPLLLVGSFIVENLVLVGASFVGAVWVFMHFQRFIIRQFFKMGNYSLELTEIVPELQLIAFSLLGCVLVSAVPITFAANRDIGRVLK